MTRITFPLLDDLGDGTKTQIETADKTVRVSLGDQAQTFTAAGAEKVAVEDTRYPFRNGWARLGIAEFAAGVTPKLVIRPEAKKP
jgi:hypothetical protein